MDAEVNGCADCWASEVGTCSFHRVSNIDFDGCDRHPLRTVRLVPAEPDETDW
jgi:hypothetical protein